MSHSGNSKLCNFRQASRIATISACAVGSFVAVTQFTPSAIIFPSRTITVPNGPPRPERTFSSDNASARVIKLSHNGLGVRSGIRSRATLQFAARDCSAAHHIHRNENVAPPCKVGNTCASHSAITPLHPASQPAAKPYSQTLVPSAAKNKPARSQSKSELRSTPPTSLARPTPNENKAAPPAAIPPTSKNTNGTASASVCPQPPAKLPSRPSASHQTTEKTPPQKVICSQRESTQNPACTPARSAAAPARTRLPCIP